MADALRNPVEQDDTLSLADVARLLARRWWILLVTLLLGGGTGWMLQSHEPVRYRVTMTVTAAGIVEDAQEAPAEDQAMVARPFPLDRRAIRQTAMSAPLRAEVQRRWQSDPRTADGPPLETIRLGSRMLSDHVLEVSAGGSQADLCAIAAQLWAQAIESELRRMIASSVTRDGHHTSRWSALVHVSEPAVETVIRPRSKRTALLGAAAGLFVGIFLVMWRGA